MADLQNIARVIPPNPSDINFERDFRTNTEALLTGIKEFDLTFTAAITSMGEATFGEGITVIKDTGLDTVSQISDALTATNLSTDSTLAANKSWDYTAGTASDLRFATLQSRFQYIDDRLDQAKGSSSTINDRFVALETTTSGSATEIDEAHDSSLQNDSLKLRFERLEAFDDDILVNQLSEANVIGLSTNKSFFISLSSETIDGNQIYRFVIKVDNHGFANDEMVYLRKNPLNTSHPSYNTDGFMDQKYFVEIVNGSTDYIFLRKYSLTDTNKPSSVSEYLLASDVGITANDLESVAGDSAFNSIFSGSLQTFIWNVKEYTTEPDYEVINIFNSGSQRFYTIEARTTSLENRATSIESEINASHRTVNDTIDSRFDDIDELISNAKTDLVEAGRSYTTIENRFQSNESRIKANEDDISEAYTLDTEVGKTYSNIQNRFFQDETRIKDNEESIRKAYEENLEPLKSYNSIEHRFGEDEARIAANEQDINNAFVLNLEIGKTYTSIEDRFAKDEERVRNLETEVNEAHRGIEDTLDLRFSSIDTLLLNSFTLVDGSSTSDFISIEARFDSVESRVSSNESILSNAYTVGAETGYNYSSIESRFNSNETRIRENREEIDQAHRDSTDTLAARFQSAENDISTINTTLTSRETRYESDSGTESTINDRFSLYALKNGSATENFTALTLSVVNTANLNNSKIIQLATPSDDTDAANKSYVDTQLLGRDAYISELLARPEVPIFQTNGTDEGKILQISGDSVSWQTPAQVDTSSAYSWIPDVAFQQIQFDGEVLADRALAAGYTYYVAGDLYIADGVTLTLQSGESVLGARLIVQGHVKNNLAGIDIQTEHTNKADLQVNNWETFTEYYRVEEDEDRSTSEINLIGKHVYRSALLLMSGSVLRLDTNVDLVFDRLVYGFYINGDLTLYENEVDIPTELQASKGSIFEMATDANGDSITNSIRFLDQIEYMDTTKTIADSAFFVTSKFIISETDTERVFEFQG